MRVAVIGSGISGLSAAWLLSRSADVTLIESAARLGGHTNTVDALTPEGPVPVDTGFIVYNEQNYPNFTAFLDHLGVESSATDMGFAVSADSGAMEYCGRNFRGLFGQRRNLLRPRHWQMVADILRFFKWAERHAAGVRSDVGIGDFLVQHGYSEAFIEDHLLPICAAIWSTPARSMLEFPARTFVNFFANHGLLELDTGKRPVWRTVRGGARTYIDRIFEQSRFRVMTNAHIAAVTRDAHGVDVLFATGDQGRFDHVVFACHADQALGLITDPSADERAILQHFRFTPNRAVLHTDAAMMPTRRQLWSAWNYLRTGKGSEAQLSLTYWMNELQPLATTTNLFVTLNPMHDFAPGTVQRVIDYEHPLFDAEAVAAQSDMWRIQGVRRSWFAGAWLGYGFHEDGLQAGLEVAERLGTIARPWARRGQRDRIAHNWTPEAVAAQ
ncbi:MAG: FAD-dependent oxidoreductase [Hyphomicrobiales bacterium]|nr:MAG: FAD-dependent oxidoreductase [Hyphomicrobiales bacterium]